MNRRQKAILVRFLAVAGITLIAVVTMVELKNWVNRAEGMRFMEDLGCRVLDERRQTGALPSESYLEKIRPQLQGYRRVGKVNYRARWIDLDSTPDEILAYTAKRYRSLLFREGFIVLRLDGRVEWMSKQQFEQLFSQQRDPLEGRLVDN